MRDATRGVSAEPPPENAEVEVVSVAQFTQLVGMLNGAVEILASLREGDSVVVLRRPGGYTVGDALAVARAYAQQLNAAHAQLFEDDEGGTEWSREHGPTLAED